MSSIATQLRLNQLLPSSKTEIASRTSSAERKVVMPNRKDFKLLTNSAHQIRHTMVAMTPVKPDDNEATDDSSNSDRFTDPDDLPVDIKSA